MCADGNQREMEIMGATSIATEVGEETTVNRESDASVLRIEKTICSTYIFLDFFFLRFDRKLIDFSARRDRSRSVISSRFRSMDSIEGEKGKSRRRTNGFHIVTSKKKGTARIAARMDDAGNRARTAYINSRLRGKSWPGPTPFFFPFFLSEARCPIFLATRQEFLALYALLFKGAREAHTPFFLGRRVALIEPLSHTRTSHESTT